MSTAAKFSKGGFHALFDLGPTDSGLDAVVFATRHHLVICITGVVDGRREIVGLEVQPVPSGFTLADWAMEPRPVAQRAEDALNAFDELAAGGELAPISANLLRGIPITTVLAFRQARVDTALRIAKYYRRSGLVELAAHVERNLSSADEARLPYLDDALTYVAAMAERLKPADEIARARSISKRTAEGRIAKARALGLLTKATGRTASGELTDDAKRLDAWRRGLTKEDSDG